VTSAPPSSDPAPTIADGAAARRQDWRAHAALGTVAILFAILAALVAPYDQFLSDAARHVRTIAPPVAGEALSIVRTLGKGEVAIAFALALGALGRRREAWRILCALLIVAVVVTAVKNGVGRIRPTGGATYSFPSGDSATVAALCATLMAASSRFAGLLILPAIAVACGRVIDGYHYPSDVMAGCAAGTAASIAAAFIPRPPWGWMRTRGWLMLLVAYVVVSWSSQEWAHRANPDARPDLRVFAQVFGPVLLWLIALKHARVAWRRRADAFAPPAWLVPACMVAGVMALSLWLSTRSTLWDRDEPRFSRATVEMVHSGDYLVPTFNGEPRLHKPIMSYWLMSVPVRLFGTAEWSVRMPAVVAAGAMCWLSWWIARRFRGGATGAWTIAMLATCPLMVICGTAATTDAVLVAFIAAAMALFAAWLAPAAGERARCPSWSMTLLSAAAIGCALLVKGPLGLVVPALAVAATAVLLRREIAFGAAFWRRFAIAIAIALALFSAWAIPADRATSGAFLREGFGKHVVARMGTSFESHGGGFWYYVPIVLATFFPWIMLLPGALSVQLSARQGKVLRAYLIAWLTPTFVVMSIVATKLPHYILPIFPALAMTTAALLSLPRAELVRRDLIWLRVGRWLGIVVGLAVAAALLCAPWLYLLKDLDLPPRLAKNVARLPALPGLTAPTMSAAAIIAAMVLIAARCQRTLRLRAAAATLASGMAAWVIVAAGRPCRWSSA
jgi:4-amino-4-deoxy-L-arabinose transferase-like glycosyltransferase/membrane-associated phospholipid phosphatase